MKKDKVNSDSESLRQRAKETLRDSPNRLTSDLSEVDVLKLVHELEVHQIELEMQNDELLQAKLQAELAKDRYINLFDFAPTGYFSISDEGIIQESNFEGANLLGLERSKLEGRHFISFVADDQKEIFNDFFKFIFKNGFKNTSEFRIQTIYNSYIHVIITGVASENMENCLLTVVNITERKITESELQKTKDELQEYFDDDISADCLVSVDGTILNCNKTFLSLFGLKEISELENRNCIKLYDDPSDWMNFLNKIRKEKRIENYELICKTIRNEPVHALANATGSFDMNGELIQIRTYILDISGRVQAEKNLKIVSRAVQQSPVSVVITNLKGDIEFVNEKFCEITGYTSEEVLGENARVLKSDHQNPEFYLNLWETILSGEEWTGEMLNRKKNGELFWELVLISPILDKNSRITHYVAIKEDITERKKLMEDLVVAKEKAEENDRLKLAFLANMSHEIRTPMNGILGFAELLKEPELTGEQQQHYVSVIEKSGARMLNIINDIVDISKIESGQMKITLSKNDVKEKIIDLCTFFGPEAEHKQLQILMNFDQSLNNTTITTDHEKLYAILSNLIKNAIKFTKSGTIEVGYQLIHSNRPVDDSSEDFDIKFYVKDTGVGIRPEMLEIVFERFRQGSEMLTRNYEGAGLGLAISKAYVEMLGGVISAESELGKGTTVSFALPYVVDNQDESGSTDSVVEKPVGMSYEKLNILIVEDDKYSEELLKIAVNKFCTEPLVARNGMEAVEIVENNPVIDLILMDIKLPKLNGYQATKRIRKFNKKVVIVAQTAFGLSDDEQKAIDSGCNSYMSKPVSVTKLNKLVESYFPLLNN